MFENAVIILNALAKNLPYAPEITIFFAEWLIWVLLATVALTISWPAFIDTSRTREQRIRKAAKQIFFVFFVSASAWVVAQFFKAGFGIPRPFVALDVIHPLFEHSANGSFPSGHTTLLSALGAILISIRYRRIGWLILIATLFSGVARVAAGVHWPVDIFGGFVLGIGVAALVAFFMRRYWSKASDML